MIAAVALQIVCWLCCVVLVHLQVAATHPLSDGGLQTLIVKCRYGELREGPQHATSMCIDVMACYNQRKGLGLQQSVFVAAVQVYSVQSNHASTVHLATGITAK